MRANYVMKLQSLKSPFRIMNLFRISSVDSAISSNYDLKPTN